MNKETIAIFDFDGTITEKDTLLEFIKFSKGELQFYFGFLLFSPLLIAMKLKIYPNWKIKQQLFSYFYKGVSLDKFDKWSEDFSTEINQMLRPKAMEAISSHQQKGHKLILISASVENWIKPWAKKMGIDAVIATKIEYDSKKVITGKFLGKNCYGEEKVNRLSAYLPNKNEFHIVAYGDSDGDKEILAFADENFYRTFEQAIKTKY